MTFTKEQAKESDRKFAELTEAFYIAQARMEFASNSIHIAAGDQKAYIGPIAVWRLTKEEAEARLEARVLAETHDFLRDEANAKLTRLRTAQDALRDAQRAMGTQGEVWSENGRWSRFYLVPGGHIHRNQACHSLRPTTRINWLWQLSGESDQDAVKEHGPVLCSFCFPLAPAAWTHGVTGANAPDDTVCAGSGIYAGDIMTDKQKRLYTKYATCPNCDTGQSVTSAWKFRKHKKPSV